MLRGLDAGFKPTLMEEGLGGTYLLRSSSGERLAMVKPLDEEPFAPHNPKGARSEAHHPTTHLTPRWVKDR